LRTQDASSSIPRAARDDAGRVKEVALFLLNDFSAFTEPSFDTTAVEQSARKRLSMHVSIRGGEVVWCVDRGEGVGSTMGHDNPELSS